MNLPSIEAIKYGRRVLQADVERLRRFEKEALERGDGEQAVQWARIAAWNERTFLGDSGCVITGFDGRWLTPKFREAMTAAFDGGTS